MIRDLDTDQQGGSPGDSVAWQRLRASMVEEQIRQRGILDERVLQAMAKVPRHCFVPPSQRTHAYEDRPLPIGWNQTISQPYMVAYLAEKLALRSSARVLEIGTGCGYQAAILSQLAAVVHSIEIVPALSAEARLRLRDLGCKNVQIHLGDGFHGWVEAAPYDGIVVTAAAEAPPPFLFQQLQTGAHLLIPVGIETQHLLRFTALGGGHFHKENLMAVRFVPFTRKQ